MNKIKIIADKNIPFLKGALESYADVTYLSPSEINKTTLKITDGLITRTRTKCNAILLEGTSIKFIASATIGYDHIDIEYCKKNGIKWTNAPGCNSSSVKQYVASALLTLAERKKIDLEKQTIGIIGVGNVGSKVEKFAKTLGMKILLNDPPRERNEGSEHFVSIDHLVRESDIITLHVPLNIIGDNKTFHLANQNFFKQFDKPKIFINTSRGEVVSNDALKQAIREGKILGCVLDVWENEPKMDLDLLNNTEIATPHIAGYSIEGKANGTAQCVNALNDFFKLGLPQNWYPIYLPNPTRSQQIIIDCSGKTKQEILHEAINSTYPIIIDDENLRKSPADFEKLRNNYPVRREIEYYSLHLKNVDERISSLLKSIGFKVNKD